MKRYTGTLVYTRECVNLVTHTNFIVLRVIEVDFWSIRSMREQVVIGVGTQAYQIRCLNVWRGGGGVGTRDRHCWPTSHVILSADVASRPSSSADNVRPCCVALRPTNQEVNVLSRNVRWYYVLLNRVTTVNVLRSGVYITASCQCLSIDVHVRTSGYRLPCEHRFGCPDRSASPSH